MDTAHFPSDPFLVEWLIISGTLHEKLTGIPNRNSVGIQLMLHQSFQPRKIAFNRTLVESNWDIPYLKGTFIKDVRFFWQFFEIPTYLCPLHYVLYPMYYVRFSLTYLPTPKSDILYERSLMKNLQPEIGINLVRTIVWK